MSSEKVVTLYVEEGILLRITNNREEADCIVELGKCETFRCKTEEQLIMEYLQSNGISLNAGGFAYLVLAILIVKKKLENSIKYSLSKDIYPLVAVEYSVTETSVSRAIWNCIQRSPNKGTSPKRFIEKYKLGI